MLCLFQCAGNGTGDDFHVEKEKKTYAFNQNKDDCDFFLCADRSIGSVLACQYVFFRALLYQ